MTQVTKNLPDDTADRQPCGKDRLREAIENCSDIPPQVRAAAPTRVDERVLDETLFRFLTEPRAGAPADEARASAMRRRAEALAPYVGHRLACVLITLPGVRYTIEVDPEEGRVVHWEWQVS